MECSCPALEGQLRLHPFVLLSTKSEWATCPGEDCCRPAAPPIGVVSCPEFLVLNFSPNHLQPPKCATTRCSDWWSQSLDTRSFPGQFTHLWYVVDCCTNRLSCSGALALSTSPVLSIIHCQSAPFSLTTLGGSKGNGSTSLVPAFALLFPTFDWRLRNCQPATFPTTPLSVSSTP
jgi:hypothetical protein